MGFSQPKGIYQQIADQMRGRILAGEWDEGERIPSVRELAVGVGVNPNTVTKSYQALLDREIIENQRGLGYFVAADAKRRIVDQMREEFVRDELPRIARTMRVLGMSLDGSRAVLCEAERRAHAMRNSQRAVVAALGLVVVVILGVVTWIRLNAQAAPELSGQRSSRTYDLTGFDGVSISGQWEVTIERGDTWRVAVDVPAEVINDLRVELDGDDVSLGFERGWWFGDDNARTLLRATIALPALESVVLSGAPALSFSGFAGERLELVASGAAKIEGLASRFDVLDLTMSGAGSADLDEVPVTDAEVTVSGAANVRLRMAGGRLTGHMSGVGNLVYLGTVTEQSVSSSGMVNIRRAE